jgi:DNA-directed RNA polymerase subunit M/transcription elongation factor TFIIS
MTTDMEAAQPARYVVIPVSCSSCKENQVVHIRARTGFGQMGTQVVECLKCHTGFDVMVPDEIIAGPFPSQP